MPNPKNIIGKGNRFSSTNQPQGRGRKPRLYTLAARAYGVSREEWNRTKLYLLQLPEGEMDCLAADGDTPAWVKMQCSVIKRGIADGDFRILSDIEDRIFGKAPSAPEDKEQTISGRIQLEHPTPMGEAAARAMLEKLESEY